MSQWTCPTCETVQDVERDGWGTPDPPVEQCADARCRLPLCKECYDDPKYTARCEECRRLYHVEHLAKNDGYLMCFGCRTRVCRRGAEALDEARDYALGSRE